MTKADKEGQRKAPILRFKGFTDAWEQRKFTQILKSKDGIKRGPFGSALKKEYFIPYGNYAVYEQRNAIYNSFNTRYYITQNKFEELKKFELVPGDIIMSGSGTIGRLAMIPSNSKPGIFNQALIRFRVNEQNDNLFFLYFMRTPKLQKKLTNVNPGSAMVNLVPIKEIKKWEFVFPYKQEQNRIVSLLSKMDSLLTLYDRKLKLLSQVKKYFLDNLFVEKEYPNLRFKGFTDAWEQRKLLKVCKKEDNKRIPIKEQERKEGNTPYFGANGIQGYIDGYTHDGTNILIAEDGANNVRNYPIKLITGKIWVNNHAHVLKVNTKTNNGNFLVGAIKKVNFYRYLVGSSRYKLTAESLNQVKIKIAKQSEQEKIGELLKNIEELLTLYENKQQHLTEIKKTLLNIMFI